MYLLSVIGGAARVSKIHFIFQFYMVLYSNALCAYFKIFDRKCR